GFKKRRSTTTNLLEFTSHTDFSKVFDSVNHTLLLYKPVPMDKFAASLAHQSRMGEDLLCTAVPEETIFGKRPLLMRSPPSATTPASSVPPTAAEAGFMPGSPCSAPNGPTLQWSRTFQSWMNCDH
ncbi:uncharacterized protein Dwil_GK27767, partial [Drosophila willistoni]